VGGVGKEARKDGKGGGGGDKVRTKPRHRLPKGVTAGKGGPPDVSLGSCLLDGHGGGRRGTGLMYIAREVAAVAPAIDLYGNVGQEEGCQGGDGNGDDPGKHQRGARSRRQYCWSKGQEGQEEVIVYRIWYIAMLHTGHPQAIQPFRYLVKSQLLIKDMNWVAARRVTTHSNQVS
jgi:hypothetical protein